MRIKRRKTDFQGDYQLCLASKLAFGMERGSTEEQVNTLLVQENAIRSYAATRGFNLLGITIDSGTSASRVRFFDRPKAQELLVQMQAANAYHLFVTKTDRAFRDYEDCAVTCRELWERFGISVHFTDEALISSCEKDKMVLQIRVAVAEEENRRRRERQVDAFAVMRDQLQRCGHHEPFGWRVDQFRKRQTRRGTASDYLVPDPEEQKTLGEMLELAAAGWNTGAIARHLNQAGMKPKGKPCYRKGGESTPSLGIWHPATVQSVLEHARHQDGRTCTVDKQKGRLVFTIVQNQPEHAAAA
jgi:DNA invertase Pin-like site-specific DNA recombinase